MVFRPESRDVRKLLQRELESQRAALLANKDVLQTKAKLFLSTGRFDESPHKPFVAKMLTILANRAPSAGELTDKQWSALAGCVAFIQMKNAADAAAKELRS